MTFTSDSRQPLPDHDRETFIERLNVAKINRNTCATEVSNLRARLKAMEEELDGWERAVSHYESSLSPIHRLPNELLEEIVRFSIEDVADIWFPPSRFSYEEDVQDESEVPALPPTVMVLSMVCGRWRDLILSTPSLWTRFRIVLDNTFEVFNLEKKMVRRVKNYLPVQVGLFLARSKSHPLTFRIDWDGSNNDEIDFEEELLSKVFSALVKQSNRWHSASIFINNIEVFDGSVFKSFKKMAGNISQLKHLTLRETSPVVVDVLRRVFQHPDTPVLESITFEEGSNRIQDIAHLVPLARNVFIMDHVYDDDGPGSTDAPAEMLHVEGIHLRALIQEEVEVLCKRCILPNLHKLNLQRHLTNEWAACWDLSSVRSLFRRSGLEKGRDHGLTHLSLSCIPVVDTEFLSLLEYVPALQILEVKESYPRVRENDPSAPPRRNFIVTTAFSRRLTRSSERISSFLPQLDRLSLTGLAYDGLDQEALLAAVTSRTGTAMGQNSLSSVTIEVKSPEKPTVLLQMYDLAGTGLYVQIL